MNSQQLQPEDPTLKLHRPHREGEGYPHSRWAAGVPSLWHQGLVSWKTIFPWMGVEGKVSGRFKHMTFIVHFISITVTSAPPQIIRYYIPEVGYPWLQERNPELKEPAYLDILSWAVNMLLLHPRERHLFLSCQVVSCTNILSLKQWQLVLFLVRKAEMW